MEFELMDLRTGKVFTKKIKQLSKAQAFKDKLAYSGHLFLLDWKYI